MNNPNKNRKASNSKKIWSNLLKRKDSRELIQKSWSIKDHQKKINRFEKIVKNKFK